MKSLLISGLRATAIGMMLLGCTALHEGSPVVKYDRGQEPRMTEAPVTGTYALYSSVDASPQTTVPLEKGDKIGFRRDDKSGHIVAVAGNKNPVQLNDSHDHYWRRQN